MITFTQPTATCMSDWHTDVMRFRDGANARVRHILMSLGLAHIAFFVHETEQRLELEQVLLPKLERWYPQLCRLLDIEPAPDPLRDDAVLALEAHLWQAYQDHICGQLEATQQVVPIDSGYQLTTWLDADEGYRAVIRTETQVIVRIEHGLRTRLDAILAALWQLKSVAQAQGQACDL